MEQHIKKDMSRFHMPGHKGRLEWLGSAARLDVTEVNGLDMLYKSSGCIQDVEEKLESIKLEKPYTIFLNYLREEYLNKANFTSDNKEATTKLKDLLQQINTEIFYKIACFSACQEGFFLSTYVDERAKATLVEPKLPKLPKAEKIDASADVENPELFEELRLWRKVKAEEFDLPAYCILHTKTLVSIANLAPQTLEELAKIKGLGKTKTKSFGEEILEIIHSNL